MNTEKQLRQSIEQPPHGKQNILGQMTDATAWYHEGTFLSVAVKFDIFHGRAEHE